MDKFTNLDDKGTKVVSSTTSQDDKLETSLSIALATATAASGGEGEVIPEEETLNDESLSGDVLKQNKTEEGEEKEVQGDEHTEDEGEEKTEEEGEEKPEGESEDEDNEEEDAKKGEESRFDKHPRFVELNKKVKEMEPLANQQKVVQKYMAEHGISQEEYAQALEMVAMLKNPARAEEAKKFLQPVWDGLNAATGEVLPQDLQKAVDDAKITVDYARELAKTRAQNLMGKQVSQQEQIQRLQQQIEQAQGAWEQAKRKTDPDFEQKLPMLIDSFEAAIARTPTSNPTKRIEILENVYKKVTDQLIVLRPKSKVKKVLQSNGSTKVNSEPKTSLEAAMQAARRAG